MPVKIAIFFTISVGCFAGLFINLNKKMAKSAITPVMKMFSSELCDNPVSIQGWVCLEAVLFVCFKCACQIIL